MTQWRPQAIAGTNQIWASLIDAVRNDSDAATDGMSFVALEKASRFMLSLPPELPQPLVVVESEDEIGLDWDEAPERVVSLTIDGSGQIGFSALFGREPVHGKVEYIEGLSETLRHLLGRLYPTVNLP